MGSEKAAYSSIYKEIKNPELHERLESIAQRIFQTVADKHPDISFSEELHYLATYTAYAALVGVEVFRDKPEEYENHYGIPLSEGEFLRQVYLAKEITFTKPAPGAKLKKIDRSCLLFAFFRHDGGYFNATSSCFLSYPTDFIKSNYWRYFCLVM
jgi:hypothetical protein